MDCSGHSEKPGCSTTLVEVEFVLVNDRATGSADSTRSRGRLSFRAKAMSLGILMWAIPAVFFVLDAAAA